MWQLTPWSLPSLAAALISALVLARVWPLRARPGGWALAALLLAATWWSLGQLASTLLTTLDGKFLAARLQYPGITATPVAWLLFTLAYTGRAPGLLRRWALLLPVPVAVTVLAATNDLHHLVWTRAALSVHDGFTGWTLEYGPLFQVHRLWAYALVGSGILVMLAALMNSSWHRRRAALLIAAPLMVVAANVLYLLPGSPLPWIDPTPLGFALAGVLFSRVLTMELFDLVPISREQVMHDLPEAVFVLARNGRILDLNPAALRMVERTEEDAIGRPLWELIPMTREQVLELPVDAPIDLFLDLKGEERAWRTTVTDIQDPRGDTAGRAFVFHDHSDRWQVEQELRGLKDALERANQELERLTTLDALTRVPHRRAFARVAEEEIGRARRYERRLALLLISLDPLAELDATLGADAADEVIRSLATLLET
ncbi:MAG: histidine kinase N-terminal 7TM domain-containing protein, partial [Pseudomonadales bacterium]|nr:histidine kinase N-terminal 7TM domain-containing protein [Pseudomonadales bacterium]